MSHSMVANSLIGKTSSTKTCLAADIKGESRRLGFELVGITPAVTPVGFHRFQEWLQRRYDGAMHFLKGREDAYEHPKHVMDSVRSVVMLAMNYRTGAEPTAGSNQGLVSRYAWGEVDYHDLIRSKLKELARSIHEWRPDAITRGVVDTAPLLERDFARLAGLGWQGKNTMLLNKELGSWFFLAALLTDLELDSDPPFEADHCGTCTRCLDACPTDAFPEPYVLDASKCISYFTIELREQPIPAEHRQNMGQWLFGCDICQEVCPWNAKAPVSGEPAFQPQPDLSPADAVELLQLDEEQFRRRFRGSPLKRPGRAGLLRNAAIVLGNAGDERAVPALADALNDAEPLIRGAAAWALGQLGGEAAETALQSRQRVEENAQVQSEILGALEK